MGALTGGEDDSGKRAGRHWLSILWSIRSTLLFHVWLAYSTAKGMRPTHSKNSFRYCWLWPGRHLARHQRRPCGGGELHAGADRPPALLSRRDQATGRTRGEGDAGARSEEHTSELQSLMRTSYAVFCLKKKNPTHSYTSPMPTPAYVQTQYRKYKQFRLTTT